MRKTIIITCIIASISLILGAVLSFAALAAVGFDFRNLDTAPLESGDDTITGDIASINVHAISADVRVQLSEDDRCRIEYATQNGMTKSVENGVLSIHEVQAELHNFIRITRENEYITIYLPRDAYESLRIQTTSGDIYVFPAFDSVENATIVSTSGDIRFIGTVSDSLRAETTSGDILIREPNAKSVYVTTTSGEITLSAVYAASVSVNTTSGDVELDGVTASETLTVNTLSGEIELYCDAAEIYLESMSGDIEGSIGSAKNYKVKTTSGNVRIPPSDQNAGICSIRTTSGDIELKTARDPVNSFDD